MVTQQKANRLEHATSPYLLQHAYNPVDWFEWNEEALTKAKAEDKPILVSIGYSSCHWCHVMERECFEKENVAEVMNKYFVCIKVDREERPDIDQIYMDAVQALGVNGGWPLNVFLTPDQKPFFGGTYFAEQTWLQVLNNIHQAFTNHRDQIEDSAEQLRAHLAQQDVSGYKSSSPITSALKDDLQKVFEKLSSRFDTVHGGMDKAPKFVMPSVWLLLLRIHYLAKNEQALSQVLLTLQRVGMGGIYDQIGGGFARYAVDGEWFAPHFEKMLYDNAQLLSLYSEAYRITQDEEFKTIVYETFDWLQREMTSDEGGFYSALDADSEGEEGKYYVWKTEELKKILKDDSDIISSYYSIASQGNWEHGNNILKRDQTFIDFMQQHELAEKNWRTLLKDSKKILLKERQSRVRPGLDDKIITSWNAMMIVGLSDAYKAFGDRRFYKAALYNMQFLENELMEGPVLYRSYKGKRSTVKGFLDDYAHVIQAQLKLYQITFDEYWIRRAEVFMQYVLDNFNDPSDGFFFFTSSNGEPLIARKKEIFDNVIPSSNAVMASNLYQLGLVLDNDDWKKLATEMTNSLSELIRSEPNYMSYWAIADAEIKKGLAEVVIMGPQAEEKRLEFEARYHPFSFVMGSTTTSDLPLLKDKQIEGLKTMLYVCHKKTCKLPVEAVEDAVKQL